MDASIVFNSICFFFFFKQKTAYELRISDWSSDVCSSDLQLWPAGHVLKNPEYAEVLRRVADKGADAFYHGEIAHDIVAAVRAHATPGDLSVADLAAYRPRVRKAVCGDYRASRLCGPPPPRRSGEQTSELQALMRLYFAVFCLTNKTCNHEY